MSFVDPTVTKIEAEFKELADDVNRSSASTRNGWVFFLAIQAYLFVALAGLTHRDLLLGTPVPLPILGVPISLNGFFLFGPLIFVMIHMGILLQHVMLARQAQELHNRVAGFEGAGYLRQHRTRFHVHPYSFTQLIAGGTRSWFFAFFLALINWVSLGILPILLLLGFQVTFLPYHDFTITWAHRFYLIADVILLTIFTIFMRHPTLEFVVGFGRTLIERPVSFLLSLLLAGGALFFSLSIATIPSERMDRAMTSFWPALVPDHREDAGPPRQAFVLTAWLFDGGIDMLSGRSQSPFARNLIVTDTDLVKDDTIAKGEVSVSLRTRDLRFAVLDRTDLHQADLTGANFTGASLREVNLSGVKAPRTVFRGADLRHAHLRSGVVLEGGALAALDMRGADFRGANMAGLELREVDLTGAVLEGANLAGAAAQPDFVAEATRQGAKF
jgi:hypothetical protein